MNNQTINHISIIGGAGHVGLPLGLAFASKNFKIHLIDKNKKALKSIKQNKMPFLEIGAKKSFLLSLFGVKEFGMKKLYPKEILNFFEIESTH